MDAPNKSQTLYRAASQIPVWAVLIAAPILATRFMDFDSFSLDDMIALGAGYVTLVLALAIGALALTPKPDMSRRQSVLSALGLVSCGVTLMIPPLAPASLAPGVLFGLFVLVIALGYLVNWLVMRSMDEMHRGMMAEASVVGFHVFATGVMLYAGAQALGLEVGIGLWALIAILTVVQLFISIGVGVRRQAPLPKE